MYQKIRKNWHPIIEEKSQLYFAIIDILSSIKADLDNIKHEESSLVSGAAGICLFNSYYSMFTGSKDQYEKNIEELDILLDLVSSKEMPFNMYSGISGILFVYCNLSNVGYINGNIDLDEIDKYINESQIIHKNNYDLLAGLIGIGIYFNQRINISNKKLYLENTLKYIEKLAIHNNDSCYWLDLYSNDNKSISLGLAHGMPSIIVFLAKIYKNLEYNAKIKNLITEAIQFILKYERNDKVSIFANMIDSKTFQSDGESRLGWCYGDLSIAYSIYFAGKIIENEFYKKKALSFLIKTLERDKNNSIAYDACLCHGTAGIAHIYNRLFQDTGIEDFKERALYWIKQTLDYFIKGTGIGGFSFSSFDLKSNSRTLVLEPGFLEGSAGIGLSLLAAISNVEPAWDECLLLS